MRRGCEAASGIDIEVFVAQQVYQHRFANGLTLLAERMDHVRSAAFNFLVPAGCVYDPPELAGIGSVLADLITRGAGSRDSREVTLALDNLGLDRSESVGSMHMRFWGATIATNLPAALEIYADVLRRPHLPEDEIDAVRALALQDLHGLEDEPRSKLLVELRKRHYPAPLGNDHRGTEEGINHVTVADVRRLHERLFRADGTILSIAGNVDWEPLKEQVARLFGDWETGTAIPLDLRSTRQKRDHVLKDGVEQTQIGVAYDSVPFGHADYYAALGAVNVLSGDMSSRLFTEIREKEGLCYAVWATYQTFKDQAALVAYAGSRNERAQRTLDLVLHELRRLADGVEVDEVARVKVSLKTSLIMQQESTSSRAGSLASDWYYLGRVRSLDEIRSAVESLTPQGIAEYARRYPAEDFTVVTLGPQALTVN
jgi:predicted Zn-dependent peptidase